VRSGVEKIGYFFSFFVWFGREVLGVLVERTGRVRVVFSSMVVE